MHMHMYAKGGPAVSRRDRVLFSTVELNNTGRCGSRITRVACVAPGGGRVVYNAGVYCNMRL